MLVFRQTCSFFFIVFAAGCLLTCPAQAQSSFLGDGVNDFIRRTELLNPSDQNAGMMVQSFSANYRALDSLLPEWRGNKRSNKLWLPLSLIQQYNSHHPYGWNDGAMIPAAGWQTLVSAGIALETGKFSVQLKPEFVYAQNKGFATFPTEYYDGYWAPYYQVLNKIDNPERFGSGSYHKIFAGQSSIRYNTGSVSLGVSTENLWWGPGRFNALVMSNNAPGFAHITLNTVKPIVTGIGSFEGQLIAGNLSSSGILPSDTNRYFNGARLYQPKQETDRYLTGITLSWQPKWVKGFFVGFTKASYLYQPDIAGIEDILPLAGIVRSTTEKNNTKASLGSLFARYVMPEEHAELYFEYGRKDLSYRGGYVAGFRKLFPSKRGHFIEFSAELTQLALQNAGLIRQSASWYTHPYVRLGYTNQGKVLGAGIGPGSNSQLADISWVKGFNKVGLSFERITRNDDFFYNTFITTQDYTRHWIDLSTTLHADWLYKGFIFSSQMALIRSLNYEWYILPGLRYFQNGYDVLNFHAKLSLSYRL